MEAGRFIKDLLYQSDNVCIPGLGTFVSTYQNARTDIGGKKISPPSKQFQFDDSRKEEDELMWTWISEQEGISEGEAKMMVADFVADINHEIYEERDVRIEGLGIFSRDVMGRTQFRFLVDNNFNAESIGFIDIDLPDLSEDFITGSIKPEIHHVEEPKASMVPEQPIQKPHVEPAYSAVSQSRVTSRKSHKGLWITILIVLLIAALAYVAFQQKSRINELAQKWFVKGKSSLSDTINKQQKADTGLDKTLAERAKMQKALDVQSIDSTRVFIPYGNRQMKFYIVAASFTNYDYALKYRDGLKGKGFDSEIVTITHKYYKVTMGSYADKQQALVELEKLKTITQNNALWLLHI